MLSNVLFPAPDGPIIAVNSLERNRPLIFLSISLSSVKLIKIWLLVLFGGIFNCTRKLTRFISDIQKINKIMLISECCRNVFNEMQT